MVDEFLAGRSGLRILDVGCGAGVLTHHLSRYGTALGIDFSGPAIELAQRLAPEASFRVASLEDLGDERFDLITVFDVMEHIPQAERPAFVAGLAARLDGDGLVIASTPHPAFTLHKRATDEGHLQIIDEAVEIADVVGEAGRRRARLAALRGLRRVRRRLRVPADGVHAAPGARRATGLRGTARCARRPPRRGRRLRRGTRFAHAVRLPAGGRPRERLVAPHRADAGGQS